MEQVASFGINAKNTIQAVAKAVAGDYVGAVKAAAQSPVLRNIAMGICVLFLLLIFMICSIPGMIYQMIGENDVNELELRVAHMAAQIDEFFEQEYDNYVKELLAQGVSENSIVREAPQPPISGYKILSYYHVSVLSDEEKDENDTAEETARFPSAISGVSIGTKPLTQDVERYRKMVEKYALAEGIPAYTDLILAIMQQESGGRGMDVMQASASGQIAGKVTPESSIQGGVRYFKICLERAKCSSPVDWDRLFVAVQSYNYGTGYAAWIGKNGYSGWTPGNAVQFSNIQLDHLHSQGSSAKRYGDKKYVNHVMRYYHNGSGITGSSPIDRIRIDDLLKTLKKYTGKYYISVQQGGEHKIRFITEKQPDFFIDTVFHLSKQDISLAKSYEEVFIQMGSKIYITTGSGDLGWPVPCKPASSKSLSSGFVDRINPISGKREHHSGYDIPAPAGADIIAAEAGTVIYSGWQRGYGKTIIIDHGGGLHTLYAHNSQLVVQKGQKVSRGQTVSKCGSTGNSTGNHCHFSVLLHDKYVNPEPYLGVPNVTF